MTLILICVNIQWARPQPERHPSTEFYVLFIMIQLFIQMFS